MSKSLGNLYTLQDLKDNGYSPLSLRYMFLKSDYKKPLDFTWQSLFNSQNELLKLWNYFADHPITQGGTIIQEYIDERRRQSKELLDK